MTEKNYIAIIGCGSYGTALAISLSCRKNNITLWGRNINYINFLKKKRINKVYLPNIKIPLNLKLESCLKKTIANNRDIFIAVPSYAFSDILKKIKKYIKPYNRVFWATKGLDIKTGNFLYDLARNILGEKIPLAIVSGPNFANELALGLPTSIALSSDNEDFLLDLKKILNYNKNLIIYTNKDIIGTQLCSIIKNIIAICIGILDGMNLGYNACAFIITCGLQEIINLGIKMNAKFNTFISVSGLGDLILSCINKKSRNRYFGTLLGKGISIKKAKKYVSGVVEGYFSVKSIFFLSKKYEIYMPIIQQMYFILYKNKDIRKAIYSLLINNNVNSNI